VLWISQIRKLFVFNCVGGFFIDAVLTEQRNFRSMAVIVRKFVDLFVTARIGLW
jgi:hypothetical protein